MHGPAWFVNTLFTLFRNCLGTTIPVIPSFYVAGLLFKLFKQSSPRDSQFTGERKSTCRDVVYLVCRWVLRARERGVSNTLLGDQRVRGRRDRIGLDSAARFRCCSVPVPPMPTEQECRMCDPVPRRRRRSPLSASRKMCEHPPPARHSAPARCPAAAFELLNAYLFSAAPWLSCDSVLSV